MTKHIFLTSHNITAPKSRNLLTVFTCMPPGIIKNQKPKCVDLMGGFPRDCVISSSLLCAHRWSSQVQFQMWEEMKAFLLVLTHSSINERGRDICAEEHMAMTVKCSSPEESLRRDPDGGLGFSTAPSSGETSKPTGVISTYTEVCCTYTSQQIL